MEVAISRGDYLMDINYEDMREEVQEVLEKWIERDQASCYAGNLVSDIEFDIRKTSPVPPIVFNRIFNRLQGGR